MTQEGKSASNNEAGRSKILAKKMSSLDGSGHSNESMALAPPAASKQKIKKYLFKKPVALNTWEKEEHRSESWIELFIDLFYVAFFIKLGDIFYTCGFNVDSVMYVVSVFLGIYMSKFDFDQYMNKFEGEDLVHKIFFLFYALGNVLMILNVNETSEYVDGKDKKEYADYDRGRLLAASGGRNIGCVAYQPYSHGFSVGWLVARFSILIMYILIARHVKPQGVYLLKSKSPILLLSMLLISINFFVQAEGENYMHTYITLIAGLVEFLGWMVWEVFIYGSYVLKYVGRQVLIPVNIHHITSRTSTFVMLVLGEAVIALLTPSFIGKGETYFFAEFGVIIIFIYTFLYFDMQPSHHEPNALMLGRTSGVLWVALHPPLAFTLFGIGMSLKLLYTDLRENHDPTFSERLLGIFMGTSVVLMTVIRSTHKDAFTKERCTAALTRVVSAGLHVVVGYFDVTGEDAVNITMSLHIGICFVLILLDSWKYRHLEGITLKSSSKSEGHAVNKGLARRGSVYAPQRSGSRVQAEFPGPGSLARRLSKRNSTGSSISSNIGGTRSHRPFSTKQVPAKRMSLFSPTSIRNLDKSDQKSHPSLSQRGLLQKSSSFSDPVTADNPSSSKREMFAKKEFEKGNPTASVKHIRRSTRGLVSSAPDILQDLDKAKRSNQTLVKDGDEEVSRDDIELVINRPHSDPSAGTSAEHNESKYPNGDEDDYEVEYVCYVDEDGNPVDVEAAEHYGAQFSDDGSLDLGEYEEELVEVVYDVDDEAPSEAGDSDEEEIEVIYEEPEEPKSHITWL